MQAQPPDRRWIALAVFAAIAVGVVVAILVSSGGGGDGSGSANAASSAKAGSSSATAGSNGCRHVAAPEPKQVSLEAPPQTVKKGEELSAVVETSCGSFEIELATAQAPVTVNSFAYLAEEGFYNGLTFHRIVPGFVIQGGDPQGNGTGGPGYSVEEKPPANLEYVKGVVAMAKTSADPPGTSGSQFFIVTGADAGLPPEYALLGRVSAGLGVVERIGRLGTPSEKPKQTVLIEKIAIEHGGSGG